MLTVGREISRNLSVEAGTDIALVSAARSCPNSNRGVERKMKKLTPRLILLVAMTLIAASAKAQTNEQNINIRIRPSQTVEERVADEFKANDLRKAGEEKRAAEEAARIAETNPQTLLRNARVMYINTHTDFIDDAQLQNELRKRPEFETWQMAIVDGLRKENIADIVIDIDRPLFTYIFTYRITSRSNGIVLATGKVTAFDGNFAAPMLAKRIIEDMKVARGEGKKKK